MIDKQRLTGRNRQPEDAARRNPDTADRCTEAVAVYDQLTYLADLAGELRQMADRIAGADTLSGLLALAKSEAEFQAERTRRGS